MTRRKKIWILLGTTSFAAILTIIGMAIDVLDIKMPINTSPDVSLGENISINYLSKAEMNLQNLYFLFEDDIATEKDYYLNHNCATIISIENHYDEDIEIQEVFFEAIDICQIKEPYFEIYFQNNEPGIINVVIENTGWANSDECELSFSENDFELSEYFKIDTLSLTIPPLAVGESVTLPFLSNKDLLPPDDYDQTQKLFFDAQVSCKTGEEITVNYYDLEIWINNETLFFPGRGGNAVYSYGIKIDTSETDFEKHEIISDIIEAGEIKTIPICFFPDCSCQMKARIGFKILHNGKENVVYSQFRDLTFYISSIPEKNLTFDVNAYSKYELESKENDPVADVAITYPYTLDLERY